MIYFRSEFRAMGCSHELVACAADEGTAARAFAEAQAEVVRIEQKYSRYRPDSVLGEINARAGDGGYIACDPETVELLGLAGRLHQVSDGLFDVTSGVLRRVWNFSARKLPSDEDVAALMPLIGWDKVEFKNEGVRLTRKGMELDFGGFGKEYACDRAVLMMSRAGIAHGYVNLAGDIRAIGPQPDGKPWPVGVQNPRQAGAVLASYPLSRGALATSGDYEKFFEAGGRRYSHILNPKTGYPANYWAAATVLASSALLAGAYTTIAMLKEADGLAFLKKLGRQFLLVDLAGRWVTDECSKQLETTL